MTSTALHNCRTSFVAWTVAVPVSALADDDPASLDRLHDIVVPAAVTWWPPAPGWYALAVIVVTIALYLASRHYRRRHARRYRVEALAALRALPLTDCDSNYAAEVMRLLRRTALAVWPRTDIVPLQGGAWWQFLDANLDRPAFAAELGPLCERLAYGSSDRDEAPSSERLVRLRDAAAYWIESHRAPSPRHPDAPA